VNFRERIFARLYRKAPSPEALPWHREAPQLLRDAAAEHPGGRALDLGCGTGAHAVYLAQQGLAVVGVDFVAAALQHAEARARAAGVELELHQGDVLDYTAPAPFDVVVDSGCLHHIPSSKVATYRTRLDDWLAPGGHYVLVHFLKTRAIPAGPRGADRAQIAELFAPLRLEAYDETLFEVGFPMGNTQAGIYRFIRP
jgi:cyclopropane fatty-acyl-phospholipid synthase-like methyltransferase